METTTEERSKASEIVDVVESIMENEESVATDPNKEYEDNKESEAMEPNKDIDGSEESAVTGPNEENGENEVRVVTNLNEENEENEAGDTDDEKNEDKVNTSTSSEIHEENEGDENNLSKRMAYGMNEESLKMLSARENFEDDDVKVSVTMKDDTDEFIDALSIPDEMWQQNCVSREDIRERIREEFPEDFQTPQVPALKDLIHVGKKRNIRYRPGEWVEIRGPDMVWRLDKITRRVKTAPPDWDWNDPNNKDKEPEWFYRYHAGNKRDIPEKDLRAPEEGLQCLFGSRPWVWQQWACIKLEHMIRFQKSHQKDFQTFDVDRYALELWEEWLEKSSNSDFKALFYDKRIGDYGRSELVNHIMKPFELIESITQDKDAWNFASDRNISCYTYLSVLGSGWLVPLVILGVQIATPIILLRTSDLRAKDFTNAFKVRWHDDDTSDLDNVRGIIITVLILYLFRVVPETLVSFYRTFGPSYSVYSRVVSLRESVWLQQEDRFGQMVGYKMDIFMNTLYVCLLYVVNIYIIVNTDDALEVILNSLAFVFVLRLDEDIASSSWWDPRRRWLTAGCIELVFQKTMQLHLLKSARKFCAKYNIEPEKIDFIKNENDRKEKFLYDSRRAANDATDITFMTKQEQHDFNFGTVAFEDGLKHATAEYKKKVVHFDYMHNFIASNLFAAGDGGMFNRFKSYRTWSRWESVLFASDLPDLSNVFIADGRRFSAALDNVMHSNEREFVNFSKIPDEDNIRKKIFLRRSLDVLTFRYIRDEVKKSWEEKDYFRLFFNPFADFTVWLAYVAQIIFPLYFVAVIISVTIDVARDNNII